MKNILSTLLVCASILTLFSCTKVIMVITGSRNPKLETDEKILMQGESYGIKRIDALAFKDSAFFKMKNYTSNALYIYDKQGYFLDILKTSDDPKCGGSLIMALEGLGPVTYFPRDSSKTLLSESRLWQNLQTHSAYQLISDTQTDYTAVLYWNLFVSRKKNLKEIKEATSRINLNKNAKIKFILVNQDFRSADPSLKGITLK